MYFSFSKRSKLCLQSLRWLGSTGHETQNQASNITVCFKMWEGEIQGKFRRKTSKNAVFTKNRHFLSFSKISLKCRILQQIMIFWEVFCVFLEKFSHNRKKVQSLGILYMACMQLILRQIWRILQCQLQNLKAFANLCLCGNFYWKSKKLIILQIPTWGIVKKVVPSDFRKMFIRISFWWNFPV